MIYIHTYFIAIISALKDQCSCEQLLKVCSSFYFIHHIFLFFSLNFSLHFFFISRSIFLISLFDQIFFLFFKICIEKGVIIYVKSFKKLTLDVLCFNGVISEHDVVLFGVNNLDCLILTIVALVEEEVDRAVFSSL